MNRALLKCAAPACRRRGAVVVLAAAVGLLAGGAAAEDLPAALLAASSDYGKASDEAVCRPFQNIKTGGNQSSYGGADQAISVTPSPGYTAETVGAYLGNSYPGKPASPFVQALIDAGAAKTIPLVWEYRARKPGGALLPGSKVPGVVHLVSGDDRQLFAKPTRPVDSGSRPPNLRDDNRSPQGEMPPPGVWTAEMMCFRPVADRILEYSSPVDHGNGVTDVVAAVAVRPERRPAWLSDQRVIDAAHPNMPARFVVWLAFRNNGDGWRNVGRAVPLLVGPTNIVAGQ